MKVVKECVEYELKNFESGKTQTVRFTEKLEDGTFIDGTTNEEVIDMLIERFFSLQRKNYYVENQIILSYLKNIRKELSKRYKRKKENILRHEETYHSDR